MACHCLLVGFPFFLPSLRRSKTVWLVITRQRESQRRRARQGQFAGSPKSVGPAQPVSLGCLGALIPSIPVVHVFPQMQACGERLSLCLRMWPGLQVCSQWERGTHIPERPLCQTLPRELCAVLQFILAIALERRYHETRATDEEIQAQKGQLNCYGCTDTMWQMRDSDLLCRSSTRVVQLWLRVGSVLYASLPLLSVRSAARSVSRALLWLYTCHWLCQ